MTILSITGLGLGATLIAVTVSVAQYFDKYYDIAQSISSAGSSVGMVIMPPLMQYLATEYGWRGACLILGGMTGNILVCAMLLRPVNSFSRSAKETDSTNKAQNKGSTETVSTRIATDHENHHEPGDDTDIVLTITAEINQIGVANGKDQVSAVRINEEDDSGDS